MSLKAKPGWAEVLGGAGLLERRSRPADIPRLAQERAQFERRLGPIIELLYFSCLAGIVVSIPSV
jgi:hypothetical protein